MKKFKWRLFHNPKVPNVPTSGMESIRFKIEMFCPRRIVGTTLNDVAVTFYNKLRIDDIKTIQVGSSETSFPNDWLIKTANISVPRGFFGFMLISPVFYNINGALSELTNILHKIKQVYAKVNPSCSFTLQITPRPRLDAFQLLNLFLLLDKENIYTLFPHSKLLLENNYYSRYNVTGMLKQIYTDPTMFKSILTRSNLFTAIDYLNLDRRYGLNTKLLRKDIIEFNYVAAVMHIRVLTNFIEYFTQLVRKAKNNDTLTLDNLVLAKKESGRIVLPKIAKEQK